jgi:hypothetical protein
MKTNGLTQLEIKVLEGCRHTDYGDCLEYGQWSFSVCNAAGLDPKVYRGVVSSLIKKGLINVWDEELGGMKFDPYRNTMVFDLTDEGKKLFE